MTDDTKEVLAQTSVRGPLARELSKEVRPAHYLQPGDELLIELADFDSDVRLPADQQVMADGTIDLAEFGRVVVASLTLEQAEAAVQRAIAAVEKEAVAVNVRLIQPIHRYYVIGEVNSPGAYPLAGHETVLDAILEAGGLTARASACDLLLARPTQPCSCRVTLPVCYRAITQLGDTTTNYHLQPGDRIFVGRQSFCEEMLAYCKGSQTCERCCSRQVACRDPRVGDQTQPNFVPPPVERIIPEPLPDLDALGDDGMIRTDEAASADGASALNDLPTGDLPATELPAPGQPPTPVPSRPLPTDPGADRQLQGPLDGELEFD
ncbi:sugar transporter [Roseiconus nitratireducens]|uniref:Sugar transporter n=2 Tax=Roseiconus nitratireducens TaxID=2605748 RepID=A0A5M6DDF3_9BACT|nr:sugar transporter [Roseiconus nitratireducens]